MRSLICACGLVTASASATTLTGVVTDSSGTPLKGMTVAVFDRASGTATTAPETGNNGKYSLTFSPGGRQYGAVAYDNGSKYATTFQGNADSFEESPVLAPGPADNLTINFQMVVGGTVSGNITGALPTSVNAAVYNLNASHSRRAFMTPRADGTYSFLLPPGAYKIAVYDVTGSLTLTQFYPNAGAFDTATPVSVVSGGSASNINFTLVSGCQMSGTLIDARTSSPLPGIMVLAYPPSGIGPAAASATADSAGRFQLKMSAGSYRFVAVDLNGVYVNEYLNDAASFDQATTYTLNAGQVWQPVTVAMTRGGRVTGRIADSATGGGIAGTVAVYNSDGTIRLTTGHTDGVGSYSLVLAPGQYRLVAWDDAQAYAPQFFRASARFESSTPVTVIESQTMTADFSLTRAGIFSGAVRDADSGATLPNMTIAAYADDGSLAGTATTNMYGTYSLAMNPGSYRLVAFDPNKVYANAFPTDAPAFEIASPRTVAAGTLDSVNFAMRRGVAVAGNVMNASRQPLSGMEVSALDAQGNHVGTTISSAGGAFWLVVTPGSYKFFARDPDGREASGYFGGLSLSSATLVSISTTSSPSIQLMVGGSGPGGKRRAVRH